MSNERKGLRRSRDQYARTLSHPDYIGPERRDHTAFEQRSFGSQADGDIFNQDMVSAADWAEYRLALEETARGDNPSSSSVPAPREFFGFEQRQNLGRRKQDY